MDKSTSDAIGRQRILGSYYSPEPYARALVEWALNGKPGRILDPSYGGCAFLRVAIDELEKFDSAHLSQSLIYGADIDGETAPWAAHLVSQGVPPGNLRSADFLELSAGRDFPLVDALVGNPPYVRHHWLDSETKARAAEVAGIQLSKRASLWAYFVVHCCSFVAPGGRMALLLPGSVLYADYAEPVKRYLEAAFEQVLFVRLRERIFDDASEETVVLLATGPRVAGAMRAPTSKICSVESQHDLEILLADPPFETPDVIESALSSVSTWKLESLSAQSREVLSSYLSQPTVVPLGDTASVSIGCVTGANDFFVLNDQQVAHLNVLEFVQPVVTRNSWITGPVLTSDSYNRVSTGTRRNLLTLPPNTLIDGRSRLGRYLRAGVERGLPARRHCQRDPWWSIEEPNPPDAFMPYTLGAWRGLSLNSARVASTNTVHQVRWNSQVSTDESQSIALSTWSCIGQLLAELLGRGLGGGVLKFEISDANRFPVARGLETDPAQVRSARRSGASALMIADAQLEKGLFQFDEFALRAVRESTQRLVDQRRGRATRVDQTSSATASKRA